MAQPRRPITAESLVQEIVEEYPQTILVFARHGMSCVGCYIASFHTVADGAREHNLGLEPLLGDLNLVLAQPGA